MNKMFDIIYGTINMIITFLKAREALLKFANRLYFQKKINRAKSAFFVARQPLHRVYVKSWTYSNAFRERATVQIIESQLNTSRINTDI